MSHIIHQYCRMTRMHVHILCISVLWPYESGIKHPNPLMYFISVLWLNSTNVYNFCFSLFCWQLFINFVSLYFLCNGQLAYFDCVRSYKSTRQIYCIFFIPVLERFMRIQKCSARTINPDLTLTSCMGEMYQICAF